MLSELRLLLRGLTRSPAYTVIAAGTLGLAIGLNTAIFSIVGLFIFEQFPMQDTDGIVFIRGSNPQQNLRYLGISEADFLEYRQKATVFEELAGTRRLLSYVMETDSGPLRVRGYGVSASLLNIWRLQPRLGRDFTAEDDRPGAPDVAILGYGFWERQFGGDPDVVGSAIRLDGRETTIIGVIDPELEKGIYAGIGVWTPLKLDPADADTTAPVILPEARLKEGVTIAAAREQVGRIAADIKRRNPTTHAGLEIEVLSWDDTLSSPESYLLMLLLAVTVGCVMLIACANVATLMLARVAGRARDNVLKMALGASRSRIVFQLLAEGALLAVLALAAGLVTTSWMHWLLLWVSGENGAFTMLLRSAEIDWRVLLFALAIGLAAPVLIALLPVFYTLRLKLLDALNATGRSAVAGGGLLMRRTMVVAQISLALALMIAAGVLMRSIVDLRTRDLGFTADRVLLLRVGLPDERYGSDDQIRRFFDAVGERVRALPEVAAAAWTSSRPLLPAGFRRNFSIAGRTHTPEQLPWAATQSVDPDYHQVLEIPLLRGRFLDASDGSDSPRVAVVSRRLAEAYWPDSSPVGERLRLEDEDPGASPIQIVGVVGDVFSGDSRQPATPILYLPRRQFVQSGMDLVVRSRGDDATALAPSVRGQIWEVDARLPVDLVMTLRQHQRDMQSGFGVLGTLLGIFAGFSLLMAAAGIYGVTSFTVAQRTREIGLRMALGAVAGDVRRLVVVQMLRLAAIGTVLGLAGAVVLNRLLRAGLSEARAGDPLTYGGVTVVLLAVSMAAVYRPVHSATRVDPIEALRVE